MRVSNPGKKTVLFSHLYIKLMILPRQARDKHRESTQKTTTVLLQRHSSTRTARWCWHTVATGQGAVRTTFIYKTDDFTKTGSGQTQGKLTKSYSKPNQNGSQSLKTLLRFHFWNISFGWQVALAWRLPRTGVAPTRTSTTNPYVRCRRWRTIAFPVVLFSGTCLILTIVS